MTDATLHARRALAGGVWRTDVRVTVEGGRIASVAEGPALAGDLRVDALLPAPGNLHSHTFQRAMAGRTEWRGVGRDNFWTWRELMYRFAHRLTPEQVEAVGAMAFVEMVESGFAAVAEFHYLHHAPGGVPYTDPAELSARIAAAAGATGIGLTLLPVLYTYGGAGQAPLQPGQARFGCDVDAFLRLREAAGRHLGGLADAVLGTAPHSLRATSPGDLAALRQAVPGGPVHIHAAEQPKEVADVEAWLGARPVRWLLDEAGVDASWCLIHASQMDEAETRDLARSGAVAGLCPVTEANLGDGPFRGPDYLAAGGRFGVGTDSNVRIGAMEELRALEYAQRLRDLARNVLATEAASVGRTLWTGALAGGAQALGRASGDIAVGLWADLVAVDSEHPALVGHEGDGLLDALVVAGGPEVVTDVWSAGRHVVQGRRHVARDAVRARYRAALRDLLAA